MTAVQPARVQVTWLWCTLLALVGCGGWLVHVRPVDTMVLLACFVLACTGGIAYAVTDTFRPMLAFYSVFNLCWLAVPATYQLSHRLAAWDDYGVFDDDGRTFRGLVVLTVGMLAVLAGHLSRRQGDDPVEQRPPAAPVDLHRVRRWTAATLAASLLLLPLVLRGSGGLSGLFATRYQLDSMTAENGFDVTAAGGGVYALVRIVPGVLALVALVLAVWGVRSARGADRRALPGSWLLVGGALLMTVLYLNPLANSRYMTTTAVAAVVLLVWRPTTPAAGRLVLAGAVAGLLLVYPLANVFRYGNDGPGAGALDTGLSALYSPDFDGTQQAVNAVAFVGSNGGHTDGKQALSAALLFVPRSVWPGKAEPTNVRVAEARGYAFTNLSLPVPAELYVDFGVPGMALLLFAWGRLSSRLDRRWRRGGPAVPLVAFLSVAQIGLIRGPLSGAGGFAGLGLLLLWCALRSSATRRTESEPLRGEREPVASKP